MTKTHNTPREEPEETGEAGSESEPTKKWKEDFRSRVREESEAEEGSESKEKKGWLREKLSHAFKNPWQTAKKLMLAALLAGGGVLAWQYLWPKYKNKVMAWMHGKGAEAFDSQRQAAIHADSTQGRQLSGMPTGGADPVPATPFQKEPTASSPSNLPSVEPVESPVPAPPFIPASIPQAGADQIDNLTSIID